VNLHLTLVEARVLGALLEKEISTPEYYPLSLNALVNACNQKSNREPVTNLDEAAVRQALHILSEQGLARSAATDSRVTKFEHRLQEVFNFHRHEAALLCVLLLRGPQTPGELRTRAERLYQFQDLDAVHSGLNLLMKRDPPLVKMLPRQPGTKESRFVQLLSGDVQEPATEPSHLDASATAESPTTSVDGERLAHLENEVAELRAELADLKSQLAAFQKQFQ
jgi:uncharacterized protein YceH (UPF0502 family)